MYLSNRDIEWAIKRGKLIVDPPPLHFGCGFDETSIDLHLATADKAKVWDLQKLKADHVATGGRPEVAIGSFKYKAFAAKYLTPVGESEKGQLVFRRGSDVIVRTGGFLLWTTHEWIETPKTNQELICFVNAKSTRARTGIVVHFTAPTIHPGWGGNITLEIGNFGPFDLLLKPGDAIAQLTVATISSAPDPGLKLGRID